MGDGSNFKVDLRGVVDLLSHHLYSGPRVYLRELLQNAVDAVTVRSADDPQAPARVLVVPSDVSPDGHLHVLDTGAGLSPEDVERFLATIGSSSKRDELGLARSDLLGQFGIGLLSCFLVSDGIELLTTDRTGTSTRWTGGSDGSYHTGPGEGEGARTELARAAGVEDWPEGAGTWVRLRPRREAAEETRAGVVEHLARQFAEMLPVEVLVARAGTEGPRRVTRGTRPWDPSAARERQERVGEILGEPVLSAIGVSVAEAGLRGVVAVLNRPAAPGAHQANRVYAKGMLVGEDVGRLLPDWAFFARAVVDADGLRLTASREALYDDDLLAVVRESLGEQLRQWLLRTARLDPARFADFLTLHELGVRALAVHDDELYRVYLPFLEVETTVGKLPLEEFRQRFGTVRMALTVDEFRQVLPVAGAQGVGVVNAGYVHLEQLVERLPLVHPDTTVETLRPGDLDAHVELLEPSVEAGLAGFLAIADDVLAPLEVEVSVRSFRPPSLAALVLDDRDSAHRRAQRQTAAEADDVWAGILTALDDGRASRVKLLLNHDNPTVRRLARITDERVLAHAVEALYGQALLLGQRPLRPADQAALSRSFHGLLDLALGARDEGGTP